MRPLLHPALVNGRTGDPALYVETIFERATLMFDLGDIANLTPRKIQRLDHVFVSHTHVDHFVGFDRLLRILVGRDKTVGLYGPAGFLEQVRHKLAAYTWNLADRYAADLAFDVTEVGPDMTLRKGRLRLKTKFEIEPAGSASMSGDVLHAGQNFRVSVAILDHGAPCLAFAVQESAHVNVWKTRLSELGLPVGPWLQTLKRALIDNRADDFPIAAGARSGPATVMPLGALKVAVTVTPGQKIGYVTDAADTPANRRAIIRLVGGADILFIEAPFAAADADLAADRAHLTTVAAGTIAREAGVRRVEPFHFSPRYQGEEERLLNEVMATFSGA
ncbi:ribonuclease Z [Roseiarcus sp.]|uniref:ribonuclease Z n=1 Tax=Roseiarcus sp. TaxID=1969460 RepID=UPI003F9D6960